MKRSRLLQKIAALTLALGLVLSLFVAVVGFGSITAQLVSAETVETVAPENLSDDNFSIKGVRTNTTLDSFSVGFTLKNPALETWLSNNTNTAAAIFTVYRYNGAATKSTKKFQVALQARSVPVSVSGRLEMCPVVAIYTRKIGYDDAILYQDDFFEIRGTEEECYYNYLPIDFKKYFSEEIEGDDGEFGSFELQAVYNGVKEGEVHGLFPYNTKGATPEFYFSFNVGSPYASYYVGLEYGFNGSEKAVGSITSNVYSISQMLSSYEQQGVLESYLSEEQLVEAREIIRCAALQTVRVEYLEELEETYLAQRKTATVSVPIYNGRLSSDDVAQALGKETMRVHNSCVEAFVYDEDREIWCAEYLKSVWLKTKAVDGGVHELNMFLDVNKSYADYYSDLKETVSCGADLYEYMFNQLKLLYPIIDQLGLSEDDVHGYFGQIWLPNNNEFASFNAAIAKLFDVKTEEVGFITSFNMAEAITYDEHNKLMGDYNYTWLKGAWEKVVDFATGRQTTAQYYFFTAKPMEYTGISQTGNTDPEDDDGAGKEVIDDAADDVVDWFDDLLNGGNSLKRLSSVVVVAACAVGVMWGIAQLKGDKKRKK